MTWGTPDQAGPGVRATAAAQVFVPEVLGVDEPAVEEGDLHHLQRVLRLRDGEAVVAADGRGAWRLCRFHPGRTGEHDPFVEPDAPVVVEPPPDPFLTIGLTPVKGGRPEWAVQKLTELGVDRIVVLSTERSVVRLSGERGERAVERFRRVAREAAAQSRRVHLPEVSGVATLHAVAFPAGGPAALAQPGGPVLSAGLHTVLIGPEGGWSSAELAERPTVGLGPTVLRAETAAVAAGVLLCALRAGTVASVGAGGGPT